MILVFFGKARWEDHAEEHGAHGEFKPHESPPVMLLPLVVLAGLSIIGGMLQLPHVSWLPDAWTGKLEQWLEPVVEFGEANIEWHVGRRPHDDPHGHRDRRCAGRHRRRPTSSTSGAGSRP